MVVSNPRKNTLLKAGNKSDTIDAHKLAELLRAGLLSPVYHGGTSTMTVKQLGRSYIALTEDTTWVMTRLKALYSSQAIGSAGRSSTEHDIRMSAMARGTMRPRARQILSFVS